MKLSNNWVITSMDRSKNIGGLKAKEDIINFLQKKNYYSFEVNPYIPKLRRIIYTKLVLPRMIRGKKIDNAIIQHPISSDMIMEQLIDSLRKNKVKKLVIWIHDIQSLQSTNLETINKEINWFNRADKLIVHNKKMKEWLLEHGCSASMIELKIFDYDNPQPIQRNIEYNKSVCFAGNLIKSEFLSKVDIKTRIDVFGPNMFKKYNDCLKYQGQYSPEELPQHLKQNFGLIWDGPSTRKCEGTFGKYLLFNNPHKTSLYLSTGIPVLIWEKAAMADFIKENNVGVVISNLDDLDDTLDKISDEEYRVLKENSVKLAQKLRDGYFTSLAIQKI
ncbi:beta-1,6-galactofuranosyltransferase [Ligilactobacillus equi]|nr:beta-1,6-galactofuranosyltransferase [Ligilactobacillus equi]